MWIVSGLPVGDYLYEEYFPLLQELNMLKDQNASVCMILWELVYHFHISIDDAGSKGAFVWYKKWAKYLFANVDRPELVAINDAPSVGELKWHLEQH